MPRQNNEESLTSRICQGNEPKYNGSVCDNFVTPSLECSLLVSQMILAVFEYGRCLSLELIYDRLERILVKFGLPDEYIDLKKFLYGNDDSRGGILSVVLRTPNIQTLHAFINRSLYNEVTQTLRSRGLLTERRNCGSCMHRAQSSPRVCQLEYIQVGQVSDGSYNRYFGAERLSSDEACSGYSRIRRISESINTSRDVNQPEKTVDLVDQALTTEESVLWKVDYSRFLNWLIDRALNAESAKRREIAQRQYDTFVRLSQLYADHGDDAFRVFLDEISDDARDRDSKRKRMERDLTEIKTFFSE